ncbi:MAG: 4-(cytidine 5'-diphospho)-2-C-methyl-D-erythritol kinase, partial [Moorella sp. (in: Bacteria)]|nr:4-(cytidine 5'-diphospho)-2-C-methyl-D-erythritol kinase [Moorella sp. (in: firmicutes)]
LGLRSDGYHELETIMQTLRLHDRLSFSAAPQGISLVCDHPEVPAGEDNLICRAAKLLTAYTGNNYGAVIRLQKNIPVAAGLAGGSADGAAALRGLNRLWGLGLSAGELVSLGARLGADVPFCLAGGTALARGKGEVLYPLPGLGGLGVVLVKPPFGVSTARAYRLYDQMGGGPRPDHQAMMAAVAKKDVRAIGRLLANVFENVAASLHPEIREIKKALLEAGTLGASLSGSGPTV